ncbi:GNAT family N-acetyltransferase [Nocardioides sp.]|uniref:GNAT family N-acetyltransferase n=1 Tax=Nocardioides sp. TaxID=35761 RepID=UPI002627FF66|nr:GNAT family N-acetyltransferase [Nocardioides sp.]
MNARVSRSMVTLREATVEDAPFLTVLWIDLLRRADLADQTADVENLIKSAAASTEQRIVIAEYDGEIAGGVFLRIGTLTPLNATPSLLVLAPYVGGKFRRKGVGRALMDAAVTWAEENGITHITTGAGHGSRDANRYLARLGLGASAVLRIGSTQVMRDRLTEQLPTSRRGPGYHPQRVLAARRVRRAQSHS